MEELEGYIVSFRPEKLGKSSKKEPRALNLNEISAHEARDEKG